jgi:hypothetical protein
MRHAGPDDDAQAGPAERSADGVEPSAGAAERVVMPLERRQLNRVVADPRQQPDGTRAVAPAQPFVLQAKRS